MIDLLTDGLVSDAPRAQEVVSELTATVTEQTDLTAHVTEQTALTITVLDVQEV